MNLPSYRWLLWSIAVIGFFADQGTKYGMFRWLYSPTLEGQHVVFGTADSGFRFVAQFARPPQAPVTEGFRAPLQAWNGPVLPYVNHGALFGLGQEYQKYANSLFAIVSVIAAVAILGWSLRKSSCHDRILCIALGLILAGTLGNLFDRVVFGGVRDFMHYDHWFNWPVFNVADCFLVTGAGLLLLQAFLTPAKEKTPLRESAAAA